MNTKNTATSRPRSSKALTVATTTKRPVAKGMKRPAKVSTPEVDRASKLEQINHRAAMAKVQLQSAMSDLMWMTLGGDQITMTGRAEAVIRVQRALFRAEQAHDQIAALAAKAV